MLFSFIDALTDTLCMYWSLCKGKLIFLNKLLYLLALLIRCSSVFFHRIPPQMAEYKPASLYTTSPEYPVVVGLTMSLLYLSRYTTLKKYAVFLSCIWPLSMLTGCVCVNQTSLSFISRYKGSLIPISNIRLQGLYTSSSTVYLQVPSASVVWEVPSLLHLLFIISRNTKLVKIHIRCFSSSETCCFKCHLKNKRRIEIRIRNV